MDGLFHVISSVLSKLKIHFGAVSAGYLLYRRASVFLSVSSTYAHRYSHFRAKTQIMYFCYELERELWRGNVVKMKYGQGLLVGRSWRYVENLRYVRSKRQHR